MPKEVATAILTDRLSKTTNNFRKTCKRARWTVLQSDTPLVSDRRNNPSDRTLYVTARREITDPLSSLHGKTFSQLAKWYRRAIQRRLKAQAVYIKLDNKDGTLTGKAEIARLRMMAALERQAEALDNAADTVLEEMNNRTKKAK